MNRAGELVRTSLVVSAVVGIVLGLIALFWPGATLLSIAVFFGVALLVGGIFRFVSALVDREASSSWRVALAVVGVLLVLAGALVLARPTGTLVFIALVIGVGWIISGIRDVVFGLRTRGRIRALAVVSGVVSVLGGIAMFALPGLALSTFTAVGGLLLVVVSVATLLTIPSRSAATAGHS